MPVAAILISHLHVQQRSAASFGDELHLGKRLARRGDLFIEFHRLKDAHRFVIEVCRAGE